MRYMELLSVFFNNLPRKVSKLTAFKFPDSHYGVYKR